MLKKPACEQQNLVQLDISPINASVFVIKHIFITYSREWDIQKELIKKKIKSFQNGYSDYEIRIKGIQF